MNDFLKDTLQGLTASPKYLSSKYFYDEAGDEIFREIMDCPEYYLTKCELDVFTKRSEELSGAILSRFSAFDIVELGPGDCTKTIHLLRSLLNHKADFTYYPIDISANVIKLLDGSLPVLLPGIKVHGLNGEYVDMVCALKEISGKNKVVLFLGSNIGNIPMDQNVGFFRALKTHLLPGDLVLTGFDLVKDPAVILAAYNDSAGITRRFNLNLLHRINNDFSADFDLSCFQHAPIYDEVSGSCKSYLVSMENQQVRIGDAGIIDFKAGEKVFMEISQKYTVRQTDEIAAAAGFIPAGHFYDSKKWFLDALWQVPA
jgi:L-histidine N-alpha-methyltransferase